MQMQSLLGYPRANVAFAVSTGTQNLNMFAALGTLPYPVDARFSVAANGSIGSANAGTAACRTTGSWGYGSWLRFTNSGVVVGMGGVGGSGGSDFAINGAAGGSGGVALEASWPLSLNNSSGTIYGGGGGGGGGGCYLESPFGVRVVGGGGGGGGGGGWTGGNGGIGGTGTGNVEIGTTGTVGTYTVGGGGGGGGFWVGDGTGGPGGSGGAVGAVGAAGGNAVDGGTNGAGGAGGAAGRYISGTAFIIWLGTGTVKGAAG